MKYALSWEGNRVGENEWFPASVPGNIQRDYGIFKEFGDIHYGKNVEKYEPLEDDTWLYRTRFQFTVPEGERLFFVSDGIDYQYEIALNGTTVFEHEGMFARAEVDLTDHLAEENCLTVKILPHPVGLEQRGVGRDEASRCCKPAVGYGWDWHPRLLASGLWRDAWLETRCVGTIRACHPTYTLNADRTQAQISFEIDCDTAADICLYDPDGVPVYQGQAPSFTLDGVRLWWCNGQGEQCRYRYTVKTQTDRKEGYIGFRTVSLVMNEGSWDEPSHFPKSRSVPPATVCLNGRNIFAKGSNFVRPELFPGVCGRDTYQPLVQLAKEANMNLFRCWGGSEIFKDEFYDLCDEMGIMVWQEFPLACNAYPDESHYLAVLEQEATAIIKKLRLHPSLTLWCGGNELFNNWSGMTDQSLPLRLLNRLCYELDRGTPFIATSPLMGMAHGGYVFRDYDTGEDVFYRFSHSDATAYTEFGTPGMSDPDYLKTFIPEEELFPVQPGGAWEKHHALNAWDAFHSCWSCLDIVAHYFGEPKSLTELCGATQWLQYEGIKAIFEEARRQWPRCSMAANWCYNEPWKTAANNSLLSYPNIPKAGYHAAKEALRPAMPSARIEKFDWDEGELFWAELWLLNDRPEPVAAAVTAYLLLDGQKIKVMEWKDAVCGANAHCQGHRLQYRLPKLSENAFTLRLESDLGISEYKLFYRPKKQESRLKILNM